MFILLKMISLGIWFSMMMILIFATRAKSKPANFFSLKLDDPNQAERQIYYSLHKQQSAKAQLYLEIPASHPACWELTFIADCLSRKNPAILFQVSGLKRS